MGLLQDGQWVDQWYDTKSSGGRFVRKASAFRNWVTADGAAGLTGVGGFKAEAGRYHLYVSLARPKHPIRETDVRCKSEITVISREKRML